jgi:hypothetical protein
VTSPATTFSGFERLAHCPGSIALPHATYETGYSTRGTALHGYLEAIAAVGPDEALASVPDEWRAAAAALDLTGLDDRLGLAAEVSYAYDVETDTARELGRGLNRDYRDIKPSEIPGTVDVVGVDVAGGRGIYVDWKMGWQVGRKKLRDHWQLDLGMLAIARCYGLTKMEGQLGHIREGAEPIVKRKVLEALDLDLVADDVRTAYQRALEQRRLVEDGKMPTELHAGEWCTWCGARNWCPVRTSMIRAVVSTDEFDDLMRIRPLSVGMVPEALRRVKAAKSILNAIERAIYAAAREQPIKLGVDDDGTEHWIGYILDEGNEQVAGDIADQVLTELYGADVAAQAVTRETSKAAIERVLKPLAKRGEFAGMLRNVLAGIRAKGGITRPPREGVREYPIVPIGRRKAG